jgi:acyl dehydratase
MGRSVIETARFLPLNQDSIRRPHGRERSGNAGLHLDDFFLAMHNSFLAFLIVGSIRPKVTCLHSICWGAVAVARHLIPTMGFDDLVIGDEWESPCRTVTEADVVAFAGLSGDFNPIHVDHEQARRSPFGRPIAHGLLGLALASGLASAAPRVDTMAFLAILDWKFLHPIVFGDTIQVITRVVALEPRSRGRRGVVTWHRRLINQHGKTLQEGTTQTLVRSRQHPEAAESNAPPGTAP